MNIEQPTTRDVTLTPAGDGLKTVSVHYKSGGNLSSDYSSAITLCTAGKGSQGVAARYRDPLGNIATSYQARILMQ